MSNYSSLLEAFQTVDIKEPSTRVEYRLYYNVDGKPMFMSSDTNAEGNYINIDQATYEQGIAPTMRVVDNDLTYIEQVNFKKNLEKANYGYKVVKNHPALIIEDTEQFDQVEYYAKPS